MRLIISISLLLSLAGCADLGYYWHSARGHMALMNQRVDIERMLADPDLGDALRERLRLVQDIRRFSVARLKLPDNGSYTRYVDLGRSWVLQNLFAAPEFSTRLHTWCYPVIGCAGYRGYFDEERLQREIAELEDRGLEVYVAGVSAYSTLGWFDDPVLSSFIDWPDYRLAGLLFHELTHQQVYIDDDTAFNESLASAVQQVGTGLWLESRHRPDQIKSFERWLRYRGDVIALIGSSRERLDEIYALALDDDEKRARKAAVFAQAREAHREIAASHGITGGYTRWFAEDLNNAKLGSIAVYNSMVPAFVNMIRALDYDFTAFYAYAGKLGKLEREARDRCLAAWDAAALPAERACPALR